MAKCGYVCVNCGQCKGKLRAPILVTTCLSCGHRNEKGSVSCSACGASLELQAGVSNTAGTPVGRKLPVAMGMGKGRP